MYFSSNACYSVLSMDGKEMSTKVKEERRSENIAKTVVKEKNFHVSQFSCGLPGECFPEPLPRMNYKKK